MIRYVVVSLASGVLFAAMDGLIHANPFARRLLECYKPIARETVNAPVGMAIDVVYGFVMAALFLMLAASLPGGPLVKGAMFGLIAWFFRVAMGVVGQWMTFKVPGAALAYLAVAGLVEMVALGVLYGVTLRHT